MPFPPLSEQMDIIRRNAVDVLPEQELAQKIERSIKSGKPLIAKLGCDPSRPDLHIGHAVVLRKLREFQELGHKAVLIIGDFTAMIGDPTGKSKTRPSLTIEETRKNGQSYLEQAGIVLDTSTDKLSVVYNGDWLGAMTFTDVVKLAANYTVSQMLEREDFHNRFESETPISIHEFLYPLAQGMDSVHIKSDIELGGTDQKFNLLVGRELMKSYGLEAQCILTLPLLEGTDGVEKMSKSLNNFIALTDTPREMFGKAMSVPDRLTSRYLKFAANASSEDVSRCELGLSDGTIHPRDAKVELAKKLVSLYHGEAAGISAFEEFERIFVKKDLPDEIEEMTLSLESSVVGIVELLAITGLAASKSEARRLIQGGGVSIDGDKVSEINATIDIHIQKLVKVGKRKFLRVKN